jgi:excisionase family DNA binding protein
VSELRLNLSADVPHSVIVAIAEEVAKIIGAGSAGGSDQPVWLTVPQAAEYLGWPKQRLYNLTRVGAVPHRKHGNRLMFKRTELDEWLDAYAHGPSARMFQRRSNASLTRMDKHIA